MAITVKHKFVSAIPDGADATVVRPSNWNDDHDLTGTIPVANGGTGVTTSSGADSVVLRDANQNIAVNAIDDGYINTVASGTQIVLTVSSVRRYTITGSGGQTFKLPNATTLVNGAIFEFDNNQSSGAITVNNNSNTLVVSVPSGGIVRVDLLSNSIAAGSWDRHDLTPANVSWSTNTLDYAGSITSATWNGNVVAYNRGGTGQSSLFVAGGIVYGSTTTALAVTSIGTTGQALLSAGASAPTWGDVVTPTGTQTLTNKTILPRVSSTTSISSPLAWNSDNFDLYAATAQAGALTISADAGTPADGEKIQFRFTCDATPRVITFTGGASKGFKPIGVTMTVSGSNFTYTLTASKTTYFGAIYNSSSARWEIVAISQEV
jgi:hypothetical protein